MKTKLLAFNVLILAGLLAVGCGKDTTNQQKGILLQMSPSEAPAVAFLPTRLFDSVLGIQAAHAATPSFNYLKMCVGEVVYETVSGVKGASPTSLKPGLVEISPAGLAQTIGAMDLEAGTKLKNIKFTIEKVPSLCQGAEYAVLFNSGSEEKTITQNTAFKFEFDEAGYDVTDGNVVTLYLGKVADSMVQLGSDLNNESIQSVNCGQAR